MDLSVSENAYRLYEALRAYEVETWINNAGFGNYESVAEQDLHKIQTMLHLNVEALTILSSLYVRDYKDVAVFLLALYDSEKTVGIVDRERFVFRLSEPMFSYAGRLERNQKQMRGQVLL